MLMNLKNEEESIKKYLAEDISPEIKTSPAKIAWMALSNALFNIQQYMKHRENELIPNPNNPKEGKRHPITTEDVKKLLEYIDTTINNCISATIPNIRKQG